MINVLNSMNLPRSVFSWCPAPNIPWVKRRTGEMRRCALVLKEAQADLDSIFPISEAICFRWGHCTTQKIKKRRPEISRRPWFKTGGIVVIAFANSRKEDLRTKECCML